MDRAVAIGIIISMTLALLVGLLVILVQHYQEER